MESYNYKMTQQKFLIVAFIWRLFKNMQFAAEYNG